MKVRSSKPPITYMGAEGKQGSYVLRIEFPEDRTMAFGRFDSGKLIDVPAGEYLYNGSAMAEKGSTCLARRLLRHATRTGDRDPHKIRERMLKEFPQQRLSDANLQPPSKKTLHWNVDHLLDVAKVKLVRVYVVRSP